MNEFFEMGGYGNFIWSSYGLSAGVLIFLVIISVRQLRQVERDLAPLEETRRSFRKRPVKEGATS
ncbi:heme exporter protein CcmD [Alphaproteobacteria bacterium 46_93_T64]|nr:heme exporter protein CcmD [Alphaproteobacteria bacterium 46_93_T64]